MTRDAFSSMQGQRQGRTSRGLTRLIRPAAAGGGAAGARAGGGGGDSGGGGRGGAVRGRAAVCVWEGERENGERERRGRHGG